MPRLIDADALDDILRDEYLSASDASMVLTPRGSIIFNAVLDRVRCIAISQPIIDAEPVRHGRWVKDDLYNTVCSVCGERIPCIEEYDTDDDCGGTYDVEIDETPYCPNCGGEDGRRCGR